MDKELDPNVKAANDLLQKPVDELTDDEVQLRCAIQSLADILDDDDGAS